MNFPGPSLKSLMYAHTHETEIQSAKIQMKTKPAWFLWIFLKGLRICQPAAAQFICWCSPEWNEPLEFTRYFDLYYCTGLLPSPPINGTRCMTALGKVKAHTIILETRFVWADASLLQILFTMTGSNWILQ